MSISIKTFLDSIKRSLWIIPSFMTIAGLLLGIGLNYLDAFFWDKQTPYLGQEWGVNLQGIESLFSSIAGAIITAMTTILSITVLVFTVLSGQYGAHVLRVFKIRTFSKFVVGWLSATFIYLIYHIYRLSTNGGEYIPQISITIGMFLTIVTLFLLIFYVHFLVRQIQISTVISQIAGDLIANIESLEQLTGEEEVEKVPKFSPKKLGLYQQEVIAPSSGYIQTINKTKLMQLAKNHDITIEIKVRPGDYVLLGEVYTLLYTMKNADASLIEKINACFVLGEKRLPIEDMEWNLEVLIEMILRALSPGINDLIVANCCVDYIGNSIALLTTRKFPQNLHHGDNGRLLLISKEFSFEGYLEAALNPIRQYSAKHCVVAIHLLDNLLKSLNINKNPLYHSLLVKHFKAQYNAVINNQSEEIDLKSIEKRYDIFQKTS